MSGRAVTTRVATADSQLLRASAFETLGFARAPITRFTFDAEKDLRRPWSA